MGLQPMTRDPFASAPEPSWVATRLAGIRRVALPLFVSLLCFWVAIGILPHRHNQPRSAVYVLGAASACARDRRWDRCASVLSIKRTDGILDR